MWEIFHLGFAMPYGKITKVQDLIEFLRNGRRLDIPQFCPKNLYDLMIKCWNENPFSRYVIDTIQDFFCELGMNASSGYKHFFTKSCHSQTYQNY